MNGRRARHIRWLADAACREMGTPTARTEYAPQTTLDRAGQIIARWPERRLSAGPRLLARKIRRIYTRTGQYPIIQEPRR